MQAPSSSLQRSAPITEQLTLTVLPSTYRTYRTSHFERGLRVICYAQSGEELVALGVVDKRTYLLQGASRRLVTEPSAQQLESAVQLRPESGYSVVQVTLAPPGADAALLTAVPRAGRSQADGGLRFIDRTAVITKPRRRWLSDVERAQVSRPNAPV